MTVSRRESEPVYPFLFPLIGICVLVGAMIAFRLGNPFLPPHTGISPTSSETQRQNTGADRISSDPAGDFSAFGTRFPDLVRRFGKARVLYLRTFAMPPTDEEVSLALVEDLTSSRSSGGAAITRSIIFLTPVYWIDLLGPQPSDCTIGELWTVRASDDAGDRGDPARFVLNAPCAGVGRIYLFGSRQAARIRIMDPSDMVPQTEAWMMTDEGGVWGTLLDSDDNGIISVRTVSPAGFQGGIVHIRSSDGAVVSFDEIR